MKGGVRGLFGWLVERALEHDDAPLLVSLLAQRMKQERIVRPGMSRLERMVAAARQQAARRPSARSCRCFRRR